MQGAARAHWWLQQVYTAVCYETCLTKTLLLLSSYMRSILAGNQFTGLNYSLDNPTEQSSTVKSLQKHHSVLLTSELVSIGSECYG